MPQVFNRARMTTATTGTGTITLGSAVTKYQSFAAAGVTNGTVVHYTIEDGTAWEIGTGTYTASGTTLSRTLVQSSTGSLLNLSGGAEVFITAPATAIRNLDAIDAAIARANLGIGLLGSKLVVYGASPGLLGGLYTPSSGTKAILVIMTGAGGAGGAAAVALSGTGLSGGGSGAGGSTIIFTMPATSSDTFQIAVGAQTSATAPGVLTGPSGAATTFSTSGGVVIATAPGGGGGRSGLTLSTVAANNGDAVLGSAVPTPNASYITSYIASVGGGGEPPIISQIGTYTSTAANPNATYLRQGAGGGTFWGPGGTPQTLYNFSTSTGASMNSVRVGTASPIHAYGGGGTGGLVLKRNANGSNYEAAGGPGQAGVCMILELKG